MKKPQLSKAKQKWFKILAVMLPVIILLVTELMLRVFHYGQDTQLFIQDPDAPNYYVINKYASQRYFSDEGNATLGSIDPFLIIKPKNTVRIFVLGESTTAGYPYYHNGSFHKWLLYRLMHTYTNTHFEIVNVSLTAVNSYTVLDFGNQIVDYEPDAVLVYTGHNEYYGALGVGSTSHIANSRMLIKAVLTLRKLRLVQLIDNIIATFKKVLSGNVIDQRENLMKRMAANQEIAFGSEQYNAGISQYQQNMDELCQLLCSKNIPLFLSTLVSNEKDQKPFISGKQQDNADLQFEQANKLYEARSYILARRHYIRAKEFDKLRFRAPEAMNETIIALAKKYANIHLVQAREIFIEHSSNGILGHETLLEHVHPNLYGYALLSEAFYQAIEKAGLLKTKPQKQMSFSELLTQMPVTQVDSLYGAYTIMMLESGWPFNKPIPKNFKRGMTISEQLAGALSVNRISWMDAMNQLFQYSMKSNDKKTALKAVEAVILEMPRNTIYKTYAGRISFDLGDYQNAVYYFKLAFDQEQIFENAQNLFLVLLKTDQPEKALVYIQTASRLHPQDTKLPILLSKVNEIIDLKAKLNTSPKDNVLHEQLSQDYHLVGADEAAAKYK
ncbi:MAG: hypothetical protein ABI367_07065 [Mucilaginibacter sp.]